MSTRPHDGPPRLLTFNTEMLLHRRHCPVTPSRVSRLLKSGKWKEEKYRYEASASLTNNIKPIEKEAVYRIADPNMRGYVEPSQLARVLGQLGLSSEEARQALVSSIMDKARSIEDDAGEVITQDEFFTEGLADEMILTFNEHGLQSKIREVPRHMPLPPPCTLNPYMCSSPPDGNGPSDDNLRGEARPGTSGR